MHAVKTLHTCIHIRNTLICCPCDSDLFRKTYTISVQTFRNHTGSGNIVKLASINRHHTTTTQPPHHNPINTPKKRHSGKYAINVSAQADRFACASLDRVTACSRHLVSVYSPRLSSSTRVVGIVQFVGAVSQGQPRALRLKEMSTLHAGSRHQTHSRVPRAPPYSRGTQWVAAVSVPGKHNIYSLWQCETPVAKEITWPEAFI